MIAITIAINPAMTHTRREAGPSRSAPKAEATYISAPTIEPTTKLTTSKSPNSHLKLTVRRFIEKK
ncbi:MAG: hypothetical protein ACP6IS_12660 [Candidatus Asgardarchaeia archaeon]